MTIREKLEREINGTRYEIWLKEESDYRKVRVVDKDILEEKGHSYMLVRDERERYEPDIFASLLGAEPESLPPRSEHIADALNEAISRKENTEDCKQELRDEMTAVMDAAEEVWEDELLE